MRRMIITIAALVALTGVAEAHSRHHYDHHHTGHNYTRHARHLHFRGHHRHHHHYGYRTARHAAAVEAPAAQPWFGAPGPEYPQARRGEMARTRSMGGESGSFGARFGAGRLVRASWYGGGERLSSRTASGEHFNSGGLTAAHRSLPFGTRVQVTNVQTGRAVVVRINDRGPFVGGRSLDLARGAAQAIGLHSTGAVRMVVLN